MPSRISNASRATSVQLTTDDVPLKKQNDNAKTTISSVAPTENAKKRSGIAEFFTAVWNWILKNIFCCFTKASSKTEGSSQEVSVTDKDKAEVKPEKSRSTKADASSKDITNQDPITSTRRGIERKADKAVPGLSSSPSLSDRGVLPIHLPPPAHSVADSRMKQDKSVSTEKPPVQSSEVTASSSVNVPSSDTAPGTKQDRQAVVDKPAVQTTSAEVSSPTPQNISVKFVGVKEPLETFGVGTSIVSTFSQMFDPPLLTREEATSNVDKSVGLDRHGLRISLGFCQEKADAVLKALEPLVKTYHIAYSIDFSQSSKGVSSLTIYTPENYLPFLAKECKMESPHIRDLLNARHSKGELDDEGYQKAWKEFESLCKSGVIKNPLSDEQLREARHLIQEQKQTASSGSVIIVPRQIAENLTAQHVAEQTNHAGLTAIANTTSAPLNPLLVRSLLEDSGSANLPSTSGLTAPRVIRSLLDDSGSAALPSPKDAKVSAAMARVAAKSSPVSSLLPADSSATVQAVSEKPETNPVRFVGVKEPVKSVKNMDAFDIVSSFSQMFDPPFLTLEAAKNNTEHYCTVTSERGLNFFSYKFKADEADAEALFQALKKETQFSSLIHSAGMISIKSPSEYIHFLNKYCLMTPRQIRTFIEGNRDELCFRDDSCNSAVAILEQLWLTGVIKGESPIKPLLATSLSAVESVPLSKPASDDPFSHLVKDEESSEPTLAPLVGSVPLRTSSVDKKKADIEPTSLLSVASSPRQTAQADLVDEKTTHVVPLFDKVDSGTLTQVSTDSVTFTNGKGGSREDFLKAYRASKWLTPPPVIGMGRMVSKGVVEYLMTMKKDTALGVKHVLGDRITNMLGALHTVVVPVCAVNMTGDYQWKGFLDGKPFGKNQVRSVIMSASIHPDFENDDVVKALVKVRDFGVAGKAFANNEIPLPEATKLKDPQAMMSYDIALRDHMIYHLMSDHRMPAVKDIPKGSIKTFIQTVELLEQALQHAGDVSKSKHIQVSLRNQYMKLGDDVISLEALFNLYREQIRSEFAALNPNTPQGMVYTIDPPSIFANTIGGAKVLNRLQALAFHSLRSEGLFSNLKVIGYNDYADKDMVELFQKALPNVKVVSKATLFDKAGYVGPKGLALVIHNNSDGFGQNIQFEEATSMDGVIGMFTDAAVALLRDRSDLCKYIVRA